MPHPPEPERRSLEFLASVLAVAVMTCWGCAFAAAARAPWVPDLYNLVYHGDRPTKGESTAGFLFAFPAMLTFGLAVTLLARVGLWPTRRRNLPAELQVFFTLMWTAILFCLSIHRSWIVYTYDY